jgi:NAD(P)-dependent dehydrogenase (short-subunit alcohol dehydrogenase family)
VSEEFKGKAALVTGGSRGIGLGIAAELLARGARVAITARKEETLREAAAQLDAGDRLLTISAHAGDYEAAPVVAKQVIDRFGSLDLLVNNAGTNPIFGLLMDAPTSAVEKVMQVNVVGALAMTQAAWHGWMKEHGGAVVNVASIAGLKSSPFIAAYGASKAALINLTTQLSVELAPSVRVNAVAPAVVKTKFAEALYVNNEEQVAAAYPMKRLGVPEDVAGAVCFLLSEGASWITGETLPIDGGILKTGGA